jgi:hypothetical protein
MAQVGQTTLSAGTREWALHPTLGAMRQVVVPVNFTLNHIGAFLREQNAVNANNVRAALLTTGGALIHQTSILTAAITSTSVFSGYQLNFAGQSLSAGTYVIAISASGTNGNVVMHGDNDSTGQLTYIADPSPDTLHPTFPADLSTFVRTDAARQWDLYLDYTAAAAGPAVSSVTPSTMRGAQTGIAIVGTGFGASQGGGFVRICPSDDIDDVNGVNQTITAWGDTGITFNAVAGALSMTAGLYLFVENDSAASNAAGFAVQFDPAAALLAIGAGLLD